MFECPFEECKFVSDRKFTGIRSHLLVHFSEQIKKGAKPRAQLSDREKIACMSKTGCSMENLEARGELVHHYGIFHCLVDDYFQEHAMEWFKINYRHFFDRNLCPYDDLQCENEEGLLDHLVLNHYYNLILAEVENMVMFKLTYSEKQDKQFNVYKCPFCKLRFSNEESNKDLKELVIHCGSQHGFASFYLLADKHIEDTRRMVIMGMMEQQVKEEPGEKKAKLEPDVVVKVKQEKEEEGESSEEKYQDKSMTPVLKETKRSRKTLLKTIAENEKIIGEDDEVQVWVGEDYVSVPQEVDKTVLLRRNERELVDIEEMFYDESFGYPGPPQYSREIRQSFGFQARPHISTESLKKRISSLLSPQEENAPQYILGL